MCIRDRVKSEWSVKEGKNCSISYKSDRMFFFFGGGKESQSVVVIKYLQKGEKYQWSILCNIAVTTIGTYEKKLNLLRVAA